MILGKSIFSENGQLLLRAGYLLDHEIIFKLRQTGRTAVYILEEGTENIIPEELVCEETRSKAVQALSETSVRVAEAVSYRNVEPEHLKTVIKRAAEFREVVNVNRVSTEITSIVDEIIESGAAVLNQTLIKSTTGYNQEHAVDTTLLSILLGRKLLFNRRELVELGTAAFLHDLGKLALPNLLSKPMSSYSEEEHLLMREHSVFGQIMLANSTDRFFVAQAAILYHHERQDGFGYPLGVRGNNKTPRLENSDPTQSVYPLSEVLSVADAYDNLISGRNSVPHSPENAIRQIFQEAGVNYNIAVAKLLPAVVATFPAGAMVMIAECSHKPFEGFVGAIMKSNATKPHQPILVLLRDQNGKKITPKTVDMSTESFCRLEMAN
jgi:HD-GYP domain-containing protein (c-di-GMP phosphodiesterase class II)